MSRRNLGTTLCVVLLFSLATLSTCHGLKTRNAPDTIQEPLELPPNPNPKPEPVEPRKQEKPRVMSAGELVAFWNAWAECRGEDCID